MDPTQTKKQETKANLTAEVPKAGRKINPMMPDLNLSWQEKLTSQMNDIEVSKALGRGQKKDIA